MASRPVYRERVSKRARGPVTCVGCGQQIRRPMRYFYRQVAYKPPEEKTLEWADERLHYVCRWLVYALWDGRGQEPCLSPWIPPLVKAVGEESLRTIGSSTKKTCFGREEDEEIPGFGDLSAEDQDRLLKWVRGSRFRKPERIRRLWINKQMYPFVAEPPWTTNQWLRQYAPQFSTGGSNGKCIEPDSEGGPEEDPEHGPRGSSGLEGRGGGRQEAILAPQ